MIELIEQHDDAPSVSTRATARAGTDSTTGR